MMASHKLPLDHHHKRRSDSPATQCPLGTYTFYISVGGLMLTYNVLNSVKPEKSLFYLNIDTSFFYCSYSMIHENMELILNEDKTPQFYSPKKKAIRGTC